MYERLLNWDRDTFIYLNGLGTEAYDVFWLTSTKIYSWIPLFLIFIILFIKKFPRKQAIYKICTTVGLAVFITVLTLVVKNGIKRVRPCNDAVLKDFIRILETPSDYSFFSGHAASSWAITVLVFLLMRSRVKWAAIFFIWPLLFTYSRIYVGVHYPLDLIVGTIVGIVSGLLFQRIYYSKVHVTL